ncbi:hypothetical protein [Streptomyces sp. HNM0574]|uniref:hypothetical protein n=1 Tax=Streptomyces sp. HNM0574 TaxID=2714954 RepID=UPI00146EA858|nr:hypothetical protein [Streptomyces sp. HNM0574]NLU67988.1 hypothetical protein [Streptomyces sp. HNM0574]
MGLKDKVEQLKNDAQKRMGGGKGDKGAREGGDKGDKGQDMREKGQDMIDDVKKRREK